MHHHPASSPPDFDDVPDLDESDRACLAATARLWASCGKLDRFDVALSHGHFEVADDEVLVETNDPDERMLTVRPISVTDLRAGACIRETQWQLTLDGPNASQRCRQACFVDLRDRHLRRHHYVR